MLPQCMQCQLPAFMAVCSDGISSADNMIALKRHKRWEEHVDTVRTQKHHFSCRDVYLCYCQSCLDEEGAQAVSILGNIREQRDAPFPFPALR